MGATYRAHGFRLLFCFMCGDLGSFGLCDKNHLLHSLVMRVNCVECRAGQGSMQKCRGQHEWPCRWTEVQAHTPPPHTRPYTPFLLVANKLVATLDLTYIAAYLKGEGQAEMAQDAVQAVDVMLHHGAAMRQECTAVPRALFYDDMTTGQSLGGGIEAWQGHSHV